MYSKSKLIFLRILALPLLVSCQGISFNPDWHVGDFEQMAIVPESGPIVFADEENFNNYACMHKLKVQELKEILLRARLPRGQKLKILERLNSFH